MLLALLVSAHLYAKAPLTSYATTPGLSLLGADATRAYLAPLTKRLEAIRSDAPVPGCDGNAVVALELDVAAWLTELATHPDGRERWIRLATATGLADADKLTICAVPTKKGIEARGKLTLRRLTGLMAALSPNAGAAHAQKDHYWAGAVSLAWPDGYRVVKQLDKAWAGSQASRLDSAIGAAGTLLAVDLDRAFVTPLTGRFEASLVVDPKSKRAARVVAADATSTVDATKALQVAEQSVPRASFDRTRLKNEWGFLVGPDELFVRLGTNEMRAADAAFGLVPGESVIAHAGAVALGTIDFGRFRRLYERVGRTEDTRVLVRDLMLRSFVDEAKTPHPKALFAGVERCDLTVERGAVDVSFVMRCSRP